jgi:phage gpG-like protein
MAKTIDVQFKGLDELVKKLIDLGDLSAIKSGLKAVASHVRGIASKYPDATEANNPGNATGRWYQRGYGPKWITRKGVHGRKTSETLGRRWGVSYSADEMTATLGNNASYAKYVHDADDQASFHAARGWRTVQDVARDEEPTAQAFLEKHLQDEINRLEGK